VCWSSKICNWADEATLDLVRYLARRLATVRALLVVTYRDDEIRAGHIRSSVLLGDLAPVPGISGSHSAAQPRGRLAELAAGHDVNVDQLHGVTAG